MYDVISVFSLIALGGAAPPFFFGTIAENFDRKSYDFSLIFGLESLTLEW